MKTLKTHLLLVMAASLGSGFASANEIRYVSSFKANSANLVGRVSGGSSNGTAGGELNRIFILNTDILGNGSNGDGNSLRITPGFDAMDSGKKKFSGINFELQKPYIDLFKNLKKGYKFTPYYKSKKFDGYKVQLPDAKIQTQINSYVQQVVEAQRKPEMAYDFHVDDGIGIARSLQEFTEREGFTIEDSSDCALAIAKGKGKLVNSHCSFKFKP